MNDPQVVILKNVRLGYADLWEAKASVKGSDPKVGAHFLLDPKTKDGKANIKAMEAAIAYVTEETWKGKQPRIKDDRLCLVEGDNCVSQTSGEVYNGYAGMMVVKSSSKANKRIDIRDRKKNPVTEADNVVYPGCYVDGVVRVYTITDQDKGGNGIFASVGLIRFRADGDPIGGAGIDTDAALAELDDFDDEDDDV